MNNVLDFKLGQEFFTTLYHNKLINCEGVIDTANQVTPELVTASFKCEHCGKLIKVPQGGGKCRLLRPESCTNRTCDGKKPRFEFVPAKSKYSDYQEIWVKPLEQASFKIGRGQKVILQNELVGAKEGETVKITGRVGFELKDRSNFARPIILAEDLTKMD